MLQTTKSNTVIVGHRREEVRLEWMEVPKSAPLKTMVNLKEKIKREGEIERKIAERKLAGGRLPVEETSSRPRRACVARR